MGRRPKREKCECCRFWSELVAKSKPGGIVALCLNSKSEFKGKYKLGSASCNQWASGHHGAVDDPEIGEKAVRLYELEVPVPPRPVLEGDEA